jgi:pimeloyl-ACP methyl ester carboxylesterase
MTDIYTPRRLPESREVLACGVRHHVTAWPGSGPPIVLLHGFMDCGATFQFMVDELEGGRPVLAPDWRGFGRSGWAGRGGYWFPQYFADLEALLDEWFAGEPADLAGHSMGGNIALAYAGLRPGRVRRLVTLEGFGLPATRPDQAPGRYREWLDRLGDPEPATVFPDFEVLATVLRRRNPRLTPERAAFVAREWAEPLPEGGVRMRFDPAHKRVNPVLYRRDEAEACWRKISAPVAYVSGTASDFMDRLQGAGHPEAMRSHIPKLEAHEVADAGHMLHHDQPAAVARIVEEFLSRERI